MSNIVRTLDESEDTNSRQDGKLLQGVGLPEMHSENGPIARLNDEDGDKNGHNDSEAN
jgi:hypothetical protein